jgi:hypothetical protein
MTIHDSFFLRINEDKTTTVHKCKRYSCYEEMVADPKPPEYGICEDSHIFYCCDHGVWDPKRETIEAGSAGPQGYLLYSINGLSADIDGNFEITAESIGAAPATHKHDMDEINALIKKLDTLAPKTHTHDLVRTINVGNTTIADSVTLKGGDNVVLDAAGNVVTVIAEPFVRDSAETVNNNSTDTPVKFFTGTQEEWEAFKESSIESGIEYVAFITD